MEHDATTSSPRDGTAHLQNARNHTPVLLEEFLVSCASAVLQHMYFRLA